MPTNSVDSVLVIREAFSQVDLIVGPRVNIANLRSKLAGSKTNFNPDTTIVNTETVGDSDKIVSARLTPRPQIQGELLGVMRLTVAAQELCELAGLPRATIEMNGRSATFINEDQPLRFHIESLFTQLTGRPALNFLSDHRY